ncbi:MAG: hypothetical protein K2X57_02550 [Xanthobacteraceae bacterium]|nr:hypothetical protein [Xanthobacteraceae bacterium]
MESEASVVSEPAVEIRPGVFRPDWSVATSRAARRALQGRTARAGLLDKWSHRLEATEDAVWRTALELYNASGRAPSVSDIAGESEIPPDRVSGILHNFKSHDQCRKTIHVRTTHKGRAVHSFSPVGAVIRYDFAFDGSAAASCCPAIAFFAQADICNNGSIHKKSVGREFG